MHCNVYDKQENLKKVVSVFFDQFHQAAVGSRLILFTEDLWLKYRYTGICSLFVSSGFKDIPKYELSIPDHFLEFSGLLF